MLPVGGGGEKMPLIENIVGKTEQATFLEQKFKTHQYTSKLNPYKHWGRERCPVAQQKERSFTNVKIKYPPKY